MCLLPTLCIYAALEWKSFFRTNSTHLVEWTAYHVWEMEIYLVVRLSFWMRTHTNILPRIFVWESFLYVYCGQKLHHVWASMRTHFTHSDIDHHVIECCSMVIGISGLCFKNPRFESQYRKPLFWHIFSHDIPQFFYWNAWTVP